MPKPTALPTWATAGTNNTEPSALQKSSGWAIGQTGVSSYDNWWKKLAYDWIAWLDGGVFDTLTVGALTVTGTATAPDYKFTTPKELWIGADYATAPARGDGLLVAGGYWDARSTGADYYFYPVPLHVGDRLVSWSLKCRKSSTAATFIQAQLYYLDNNSLLTAAVTVGAAVTNTAANPGQISLTQVGTPLNIDIITGRTYYLLVQAGGEAGDRLGALQITYTRP